MDEHKFNWLPLISENTQDTPELDCYSITGVVFTEDFGPWKKDEKVDWLSIDFTHGLVIEHNSSGENVRYAQIRLTAIAGETL